MVQRPSWEANWFASSQEIPRISRNPNVQYRTHNRPPPVSIQGQPKPVHIPTSSSWRSILILSIHIRLGLPSDLLHSGFPTKTLHTPSPHPYATHAQLISFFSIAHRWFKEASRLMTSAVCIRVFGCGPSAFGAVLAVWDRRLLFAVLLWTKSDWNVTMGACSILYVEMSFRCRAQLKPDGTRWRKVEEVKGKHASGVGSQ